jgi:DNA-binding CsgD family transcriptional regulator
MNRADEIAMGLAEDVIGVLDLDEFHHALLAALRRAIPSYWVSLNDIGPVPGDVITVADPPIPEPQVAAFARLAHQNPLLQHHQRTRDGRAYRMSDVVSRAELHRLELYREVYRPLGVEYQMAFNLPCPPERVLAVALSRFDADYSDQERDLINRSRALLIQAYRNAVDHARARATGEAAMMSAALREDGMTARESDVLLLLARGASNRDIAAELSISERTVHKHVQNSFKKLQVGDRSAAAARCWKLAAAASRPPWAQP